MDADELIKEFLTEHIDLITTNRPDATIIITAERPDGEHWGPRDGWQYLIRPADSPQYGPAVETWYYEHELLQYAKLFDAYWEINWEEDHLERNSGEEA